MININATPNPFDHTRPKRFFDARKNQITVHTLTHNTGKSFNKAFGLKQAMRNGLPKGYNPSWEELKVLIPWVLFFGTVMINLLFL